MRKWSGKDLLRSMRNWRWWVVLPLMLIMVALWGLVFAVSFIINLIGKIPSSLLNWFDESPGPLWSKIFDWVERGERNAK